MIIFKIIGFKRLNMRIKKIPIAVFLWKIIILTCFSNSEEINILTYKQLDYEY
jgi:hypothetical protein